MSTPEAPKPVFCVTTVHKSTLTGTRFPIDGIRVLGTFDFCWCPHSTFRARFSPACVMDIGAFFFIRISTRLVETGLPSS